MVGMEISFEPVLDECFRVRNIKKGAEPVDRLRDKLRDLLVPTVKTLRKRIQTSASHRRTKTSQPKVSTQERRTSQPK